MSPKAIRNLLLLASFALVGLLTVQVAWFQRAFDLKQRQFGERVNLAMREAAHRLLAVEGNRSAAIQPVRQTAGNAWLLQLEQYIEYDSVPAVMKSAFSGNGIDGDYFVALVECYTGDLLLGYTASAVAAGKEIPCSSRDQAEGCYNLTVTFSGQRALLLREMGFWVFSAFACLFVLAYFVYSLFIMLKEKRLSQMKKDFINNMTHELKTPIANIAVASEMLKNPAMPFSAEKMRDYAGLIHRENERLRGQVERVLHMAYLEENNLDLNRESFDLNQMLEEILSVFSLRLQRRGGAVSFSRRATDARVEADKFHLSNVIYGLLDNAEKYSPGLPEITVETENTPGGLRLTVADRGTGVMKSFQNYIFDKFYRAPTGDVHNVKGFGLGLSYAKMIVEAHGGFISVESEAESGSRFSIVLNPNKRP